MRDENAPPVYRLTLRDSILKRCYSERGYFFNVQSEVYLGRYGIFG